MDDIIYNLEYLQDWINDLIRNDESITPQDVLEKMDELGLLDV